MVLMCLSTLKEADKVFPFFNFFLYFITGGCDFCLCGEDSTDEGEDCAADGSIKGPTQRAVAWFVGRCRASTVVHSFLAAPASRVENETKDEKQAGDSLQEPAHVEDALLHNALHTHGEHGHQGHHAEDEDSHSQEDCGGLPETTGDLAEALGIGPAERVSRDMLQARVSDAACIDAQCGVWEFRSPRYCRLSPNVTTALGLPYQPVCAHKGNELRKGHHNT